MFVSGNVQRPVYGLALVPHGADWGFDGGKGEVAGWRALDFAKEGGLMAGVAAAALCGHLAYSLCRSVLLRARPRVGLCFRVLERVVFFSSMSFLIRLVGALVGGPLVLHFVRSR